MANQTVRTPTARQRLMQWVDREMAVVIEANGRLDIPSLAERAADAIASDPQWSRPFLRESMYPEVYDMVQRRVADTRRRALCAGAAPGAMDNLVIVGREVMPRQRIVLAAEARFGKWLERVGDHHVLALDMFREDVLVAKQTRARAAQRDLNLATLWQQVADALQPGQRVRDHFTAEQLDAMLVAIEAGGRIAAEQAAPALVP